MAAFGAWHVASNLLVVAFFGADYMILLKRLGRSGRTAASGISLQAAIMAAVFLYPELWLSTLLLAVYAIYTFVLSGLAGAVAKWFGSTKFIMHIDTFLRKRTR